jgi:phosphoglycerate dehydrogenase-like enzyme
MARSAIEGGAELVPIERAEALIWGGPKVDGLADLLKRSPNISWVQLPTAGIERYAGLLNDGRIWTSAKGAFSDQVAEHVLALALAGLRELPKRARANSWGEKGGRTLFGSRVTIVGAGGIAEALIALLKPFQCIVTVVRHHPGAVEGAAAVLEFNRMLQGLQHADVVVLAPALTPETTGMIGERELRAMKPGAWLINVGRGKLVVTEALVRALSEKWIGGAALDVTDPEPLPAGHPLWSLDNCLITPHTANPPRLEQADMQIRILENVRRRLAGKPLLGLVNTSAGY